MSGFEWIPAMVMGLLAGLMGLVVGLGWGLVGLAIGLAGGLVGVVAGLGGAFVGVFAGLFGTVWHLLAQLVRPVVVVAVVAVILLFLWVPSVSYRVAAGPGGIEVSQPRDTSIRHIGLDGQEILPSSPYTLELPAEAPDTAIVAPDVDNPTNLPPRQQLFSDVVDTWQADVYPSDKAALRALVTRVDKQLDQMTPDQKDPAVIQVQGKVRHELLVQVIDALKKTHPDSRITLTQTQEEEIHLSPDEQTVIVDVLVRNEKAKGITPYVRVQAAGPQHSVMEQANFLNKAWVDDFAAFANQDHKRTYIVAVSQRPAVNAQESEQNAIRLAAMNLEPRVRSQMDPRLLGAAEDASIANAQWLQQRIAAELPASHMIADRFTQRLQAPYGEVWQTSLLIDTSPGTISYLAHRCDELLMMQWGNLRKTVLSVLGVVALVCLVYAWLNVATKGYFAWSLRAAAIAMIVGGVFLVLLFRMAGDKVTVQTNAEPQGYREDPTIQRRTTDRGQEAVHYHVEY